jgi:hypothetical protein
VTKVFSESSDLFGILKNFWRFFSLFVRRSLLVTQVWTKHEARGIGPSPRALASLTAVDRKLYLFGGAMCNDFESDDTSGFCDLYELDIGM